MGKTKSNNNKCNGEVRGGREGGELRGWERKKKQDTEEDLMKRKALLLPLCSDHAFPYSMGRWENNNSSNNDNS